MPDPETVMEPPEFEMVVEPEYVLVADNASVPALVFVTPYAPLIAPDTVAVFPDATWIVASPESVTVPDHPLVSVKFSAPADDAPVPVIVRFSPTVTPADTASVAPLDTVVAPSVVPSAAAFEIVSVPPDTVVAPEYVFVPDSARSPVPVFVRAPVSEMTPEKDVDPLFPPVVNVAVPSVTEPAPAMDPTVSDTSFKSNVPVIVIADESGTLPESDNITVPAEIVVELV